MTYKVLRKFSGSPTAPVIFTNADATTSGNWQGFYGSDGYFIQNVTPLVSIPGYAQLNMMYGQLQVWTSQTGDPRALQNPLLPNEPVAAASTTSESQNSSFLVDINLTDANTHRIALCCVDWLNTGTVHEKIEVFESSDTSYSNPLDSRNFILPSNGVYLVWKLSGHKVIRVTKTDTTIGNKAMVSSVFFDPVL